LITIIDSVIVKNYNVIKMYKEDLLLMPKIQHMVV